MHWLSIPLFSLLTALRLSAASPLNGPGPFSRGAAYFQPTPATTSACFPAGTPVLTKSGLRPIESLKKGDLVLARSEDGHRQDWRPVVDTITTHPDTLYHLRIRVETRGERFAHRPRDGTVGDDSDRDPDSGLRQWSAPGATETIVTTGNHPFYVTSRPQPGFLPAEDLRPGDHLSLADGGSAILETSTKQSAAPGFRFTTYNLEVAQYHTYFVGREAVWVHNLSRAFCDRFKSYHENLARRIQQGHIPNGIDPADAAKSPHFAALHHAQRRLRNVDKDTWSRAYTNGFLDSHDAGARGWLDYWEGRPLNRGPVSTPSVGHIKSKHVGKTDAELLASGTRPHSSFADQDIAESVIASIIKDKQAQIEAWASKAKRGTTNTEAGLSLTAALSEPIGRGVMTAGGTVQDMSNARLVLNADGNGGWEFLTAFPEP